MVGVIFFIFYFSGRKTVWFFNRSGNIDPEKYNICDEDSINGSTLSFSPHRDHPFWHILRATAWALLQKSIKTNWKQEWSEYLRYNAVWIQKRHASAVPDVIRKLECLQRKKIGYELEPKSLLQLLQSLQPIRLLRRKSVCYRNERWIHKFLRSNLSTILRKKSHRAIIKPIQERRLIVRQINNSLMNINVKNGAIRELNPGPLVPETRIIPLDQSPNWCSNLPSPFNANRLLNRKDHILPVVFARMCDIEQMRLFT